ncbi:MAG: queuosine precursor transporter [Alphaproteobacteria bacterium]|nr:queuosine precursor transporter [Alphaproteobacteria bacterium]
MIDSLLSQFVDLLHLLPNILVSLLNYIFCVFIIVIVDKHFKYVGLCCYLVLCGLISNVQVLYPVKYELINLTTLLGSFIFSTSFLATDIINSKYGKENAIKSILFTLTFEVFFVVNMLLTIGHTSVSQDELMALGMQDNIKSIQTVFLPVPRILIASYMSYFISQLAEVLLLKKASNSIIKHNIVLFISSILLDNIVFTILAFRLLASQPASWNEILQIITSAIGIRMLCNFLNTLFYKIICKNS